MCVCVKIEFFQAAARFSIEKIGISPFDLLYAYSPLIERNESLTNSQIVRSIKQTINNSFTQRVTFVTI